MKLKLGPREIKNCVPSGWIFDTSDGADMTIGFGRSMCVGAGAGDLTVRQQRTSLPNTDRRYRLSYFQYEMGGGASAPIPGPSFSWSTEAMPSAPLGGRPIYRLPGAPPASGEGGRPTGFAGAFMMLTLSSGGLWSQYSTSLLLMGAQGNAVGRPYHLIAWKYFTVIGARGMSTSVGTGATSCYGYFLPPVDRTGEKDAPPVRPIPHF